MAIKRHRWENRESRVNGSERVNITEDKRKYAAEHGITESEVIESEMQEKRKEFVEQGAEVYAKA
jgi:hypothetical protein